MRYERDRKVKNVVCYCTGEQINCTLIHNVRTSVYELIPQNYFKFIFLKLEALCLLVFVAEIGLDRSENLNECFSRKRYMYIIND